MDDQSVVAGIIFSIVMGLAIFGGGSIAESGITRDCKDLGTFRSNGVVYTCSVKEIGID